MPIIAISTVASIAGKAFSAALSLYNKIQVYGENNEEIRGLANTVSLIVSRISLIQNLPAAEQKSGVDVDEIQKKSIDALEKELEQAQKTIDQFIVDTNWNKIKKFALAEGQKQKIAEIHVKLGHAESGLSAVCVAKNLIISGTILEEMRKGFSDLKATPASLVTPEILQALGKPGGGRTDAQFNDIKYVTGNVINRRTQTEGIEENYDVVFQRNMEYLKKEMPGEPYVERKKEAISLTENYFTRRDKDKELKAKHEREQTGTALQTNQMQTVGGDIVNTDTTQTIAKPQSSSSSSSSSSESGVSKNPQAFVPNMKQQTTQQQPAADTTTTSSRTLGYSSSEP